MKKVYRSKISPFLTIILIAATISPLIPLFFKPYDSSALLVCLLCFLVCLVICIPALFMTYYTIEEDSLHIKSGFFFHKTLAIASIRKIEETNNIISSPAPSLDRLEIIYHKYDSVLISPADKEGFLKEMASLNPELQIIRRKKAITHTA